MNNFHIPVLLQETIDYLNIQKDHKYIDATLGGGGHGIEILKKGGVLLGIDVDQDALEFVKRNWKLEARKWNIKEENLILVNGNFRNIDKIARLAKQAHLNKFDKVSGILFDLGVSSYQLEKRERGFSFRNEGPLDMRMSKDLAVTAKDLINGLTEGELYELFSKLGEEHRALAISRAIVRTRRIKPIETTKELSQVVENVYGRVKHNIHPATKVFQALRIAVNDELNALKEALEKAVGLLENGGNLAVISFHSLEDRIVKNSFLEFEKMNLGKIITKKPQISKADEIKRNIRARSAKLRVFKKI